MVKYVKTIKFGETGEPYIVQDSAAQAAIHIFNTSVNGTTGAAEGCTPEYMTEMASHFHIYRPKQQ